MDRHAKPATGRPRSQEAAVPELQDATPLQLARWAAGAAAAGLTRSSAARVAGVTRRTLQRALAAHGADPLVARDLQLADGLRWENRAGAALEEAVSRSLAWLRSASADPEVDPREVAAALGATVQSAHRLGEAGARRSKRLQPQAPEQHNRLDHQQLLAAIGQACQTVRALPPELQEQGWERLREQLHGDQQQGQALEPIDVEAKPVEPEQPGPVASPLL
jgi:hypothetical protein